MGHLFQWALLLVPAVKEKSLFLPQWTKSKLGPFHFHWEQTNVIDDASHFVNDVQVAAVYVVNSYRR